VTRKILHMYSWDLSFNRFLRTEHCKHEKTQALTQRNINTQQFEKVPSVIWEMKKNGLSLDKYSYNYWMKSCAALSDMDKVEEVLNEIESDDKVDWNIYNTLANIYIRAKVLDKEESVLKQMENKMEEQLNLPSAKHNVRLNPGNSEGESLSLGCCTDEDRDARRSFYCVKQFGQEGGMVDPAVVNGSTVLTFNRASIDTHVDAQPYETYSACSSGNSCISEYSKHICYEISCSPNQSCRPPGSRSCSSVGHSTTLGDGLDHSKCSPHYLDCKANEKTTSDDSDCLCGSLEEFIFEKENLYSHRSHLKNNQFNRLSSRKSAVQANECHAMGLLGKDGTGADSGQPIVSAYTPSIVKRHKAIKTSEFGSGSTSDEHGGCPREQPQLTVLGDIHSSFETCTRLNKQELLQ
jgi:pentatricopeptide repeat protein